VCLLLERARGLCRYAAAVRRNCPYVQQRQSQEPLSVIEYAVADRIKRTNTVGQPAARFRIVIYQGPRKSGPWFAGRPRTHTIQGRA